MQTLNSRAKSVQKNQTAGMRLDGQGSGNTRENWMPGSTFMGLKNGRKQTQQLVLFPPPAHSVSTLVSEFFPTSPVISVHLWFFSAVLFHPDSVALLTSDSFTLFPYRPISILFSHEPLFLSLQLRVTPGARWSATEPSMASSPGETSHAGSPTGLGSIPGSRSMSSGSETLSEDTNHGRGNGRRTHSESWAHVLNSFFPTCPPRFVCPSPLPPQSAVLQPRSQRCPTKWLLIQLHSQTSPSPKFPNREHPVSQPHRRNHHKPRSLRGNILGYIR